MKVNLKDLRLTREDDGWVASYERNGLEWNWFVLRDDGTVLICGIQDPQHEEELEITA